MTEDILDFDQYTSKLGEIYNLDNVKNNLYEYINKWYVYSWLKYLSISKFKTFLRCTETFETFEKDAVYGAIDASLIQTYKFMQWRLRPGDYVFVESYKYASGEFENLYDEFEIIKIGLEAFELKSSSFPQNVVTVPLDMAMELKPVLAKSPFKDGTYFRPQLFPVKSYTLVDQFISKGASPIVNLGVRPQGLSDRPQAPEKKLDTSAYTMAVDWMTEKPAPRSSIATPYGQARASGMRAVLTVEEIPTLKGMQDGESIYCSKTSEMFVYRLDADKLNGKWYLMEKFSPAFPQAPSNEPFTVPLAISAGSSLSDPSLSSESINIDGSIYSLSGSRYSSSSEGGLSAKEWGPGPIQEQIAKVVQERYSIDGIVPNQINLSTMFESMRKSTLSNMFITPIPEVRLTVPNAPAEKPVTRKLQFDIEE